MATTTSVTMRTEVVTSYLVMPFEADRSPTSRTSEVVVVPSFKAIAS